jgi:hypothetical protein
VERHGKTVGFYIPIEAKDRKAGSLALSNLDRVFGGILDRLGMTEDELLDVASPEKKSKPKRNAARR